MSAHPVHDLHYPPGTVRALLNGPHVSAATRDALTARLAEAPIVAPRFLDAASFATLRAVCARLVPDCVALDVDVAGMIDTRLAGGAGNGWRYDAMPSDEDACRLGIRGVDEHAQLTFAQSFASLDDARQDTVLRDVQHALVRGGVWEQMPATRFFEELLAEAVECFYSHPLAQESIGYAGMADLPSWTMIGLDARESREPRAVSRAHE
ncbi:MAG: gluconate 2-dehydrogenase subunit 3 family protein [Gemmatimonas sp.]